MQSYHGLVVRNLENSRLGCGPKRVLLMLLMLLLIQRDLRTEEALEIAASEIKVRLRSGKTGGRCSGRPSHGRPT